MLRLDKENPFVLEKLKSGIHQSDDSAALCAVLFGVPHAPLEAFVDAIACCVSILHHPTVKA
ncbi:hypothetical protein [Neisseria sp. Marseille-Q2251]|uniref:hypothetical protein n=1 Tax=Neisseria sp. Marseille-Q2251 TaxID=2866585 RepID=UPI003139D9EE